MQVVGRVMQHQKATAEGRTRVSMQIVGRVMQHQQGSKLLRAIGSLEGSRASYVASPVLHVGQRYVLLAVYRYYK